MRLILGAALLVACAPVRPPQAPTYTPAELVERSKVSVVHVVTDHEDGSGFVIRKDRIATSRRLLANASRIEIVLADGARRPVDGVWLPEQDQDLDLAVLGVDTSGLSPMPLADSGTVRVGDTVVTLGFGGASSEIKARAEGTPSAGTHDHALTLALIGGPMANAHGEVLAVLPHDGVDHIYHGIPVNKLVPLAHATTPARPISVLGGAPPRASEPVEPHAAECEAGKIDACAQYRTEAPEKARGILVKACNEGSGAACTLAARMTRGGEGGAANPARARALFELACERGEADACAELPKPKAPRRKR